MLPCRAAYHASACVTRHVCVPLRCLPCPLRFNFGFTSGSSSGRGHTGSVPRLGELPVDQVDSRLVLGAFVSQFLDVSGGVPRCCSPLLRFGAGKRVRREETRGVHWGAPAAASGDAVIPAAARSRAAACLKHTETSPLPVAAKCLPMLRHCCERASK